LIWKTEEIWPVTAKSAGRIAPDQTGIYVYPPVAMENIKMKSIFCRLWREEQGQDIAEYAVMLAVILVIVVGTIRLIGSNANNVFSSVASSVQ
jgi:Flp pilus assembly pilin Flp